MILLLLSLAVFLCVVVGVTWGRVQQRIRAAKQAADDAALDAWLALLHPALTPVEQVITRILDMADIETARKLTENP